MSKSKDGSDVFVFNLRRIMDEKNIKQIDIVRGLKLSTATVSQWVNGTIYPRIGMMQRLADFLGVTVSALTAQIDDPMTAELADLLQHMTEEDKALILATIRRLAQGKE